MKNLLLKSAMAMLMALFSLNANAYDACINGIYYNLVKKTKTAEVTYGEKKSGTYSGKVMIPASIEKDGVTYSVTSIGSSAFYYCKGLTSVTIPNSVTSIGHEAFQGCSSLISVTIPSSVMTIGQSAFYYCYNLTFIHITDLVAWCQIKKDYTIFDNSIPHLYLNGNEVKDLVIPKSITSIGNLAFSHFSGLTSVAIPESVTSIGNGAFQNCSGLTSVTIPNSVTSIGDGAFEGCI